MAITVPADGAVISASVFGKPVADQLNALNGTRRDFSARKAVGQHFAQNALPTITFETLDYNNLNGAWSNGVYTVPSDGTYAISVTLTWNIITTAERNFMSIAVTGLPNNATGTFRHSLGVDEDTTGAGITVRIAANGTIKIQTYTVIAAGRDVNTGSFQITRLPGV